MKTLRTHWTNARRVITSRHPPIDLYAKVAKPSDLDAVFYIEGLTDDRIREERGLLGRVAVEDRVTGPCAQYVIPSFTRFSHDGSRFSDGTYGVFYAANDLLTAVAEAMHHQEKFLRESDTDLPHTEQARAYAVEVRAQLVDLRKMPGSKAYDWNAIYHSDDYDAASRLGVNLRAEGAGGVRYNSVRRPTGECVGLFKPKGVARCVQAELLSYHWDGRGISSVEQNTSLNWR